MSEKTYPVVVDLRIPPLEYSLTLGFSDDASRDRLMAALAHKPSGARLPVIQFVNQSAEASPTLCIDIALVDRGAKVAFHGDLESPTYTVDLESFHWDFSKVLNALVMRSLVSTGLAPIHAAAVVTASGTALLPGASGAGKSTTSSAVRALGGELVCTELAFVAGTTFKCGNSAMTVDRPALDKFGIVLDGAEENRDGRLILDLKPRGEAQLSRLVFIQVSDSRLHVRQITQRRARMLLFENVVSQLSITQLLIQETWPIWMPPPREDVMRLMSTVESLANLDPVIVEGHPKEVAKWLLQSGTAP